MANYSDLSAPQQRAVDDALEKLEGYRSLDLEEADPEEILQYENFRNELEGTKIDRGDMDEDDLNGYLRAGILRRSEDGDLEINSIWQQGHIEKLEENNMYSFDLDNLYVAKDEEKGIEKALYGDDDSYRSHAEHGGNLKFKFDDSMLAEFGNESKSDQKIVEMIADFAAEAAEVEDKEEYVEEFSLRQFMMPNNTSNSKSRSISDGGEKMSAGEDYDEDGSGFPVPVAPPPGGDNPELDEKFEYLAHKIGQSGLLSDISSDKVDEVADTYAELMDTAYDIAEERDDFYNDLDQTLDNFAEYVEEDINQASQLLSELTDLERDMESSLDDLELKGTASEESKGRLSSAVDSFRDSGF